MALLLRSLSLPALLGVSMLAGCGQTGPLYMPTKPAPTSQSEPLKPQVPSAAPSAASAPASK